jgi:hypothetical protein
VDIELNNPYLLLVISLSLAHVRVYDEPREALSSHG